jgi:hypothetical protein
VYISNTTRDVKIVGPIIGYSLLIVKSSRFTTPVSAATFEIFWLRSMAERMETTKINSCITFFIKKYGLALCFSPIN